MDLLVVYSTADMLLKLATYDKLRICILYCDPTFECNSHMLLNPEGKYNSPKPKDYVKAMTEIMKS